MAVVAKETRDYLGDGAPPVLERGVIDVHRLWQIVSRHRLLVACIIGAFVGLAILYLHIAPQKYAVRMVVIAVEKGSETSGTLDDLSSLAGIDLPSAGNPQFKMFVGAMRSPFAAQSIANDPELLKAMFPRDWSVTENRWREPKSAIMVVARPIAYLLGWHIQPWQPPNTARVFEYLKDELKVVPDSKSGVVTLELDSRYPQSAARILEALNDALDERIRQRDLLRASTDVDYLGKRLGEVSVQEYRTALVTNLIQQEKTRMLASAPLPYVSDALGKPLISAKPVSPIPAAVLGAALVLGALAAVGAASLRDRRH